MIFINETKRVFKSGGRKRFWDVEKVLRSWLKSETIRRDSPCRNNYLIFVKNW